MLERLGRDRGSSDETFAQTVLAATQAARHSRERLQQIRTDLIGLVSGRRINPSTAAVLRLTPDQVTQAYEAMDQRQASVVPVQPGTGSQRLC